MRLPAPRPWVQFLELVVILLIAIPAGWFLLWDIPGLTSLPAFAFRVVVWVVLTLSIAFLLGLHYWPLTQRQIDQLAAATLCHYTTAEAAAKIMNVGRIRPGDVVVGQAQLLSRQRGRLAFLTTLGGGRGAVYAFTGPVSKPRTHVRGCEVAIEFRAADLTSLTAVRWHPNGAVRIPDKYAGPATARFLP